MCYLVTKEIRVYTRKFRTDENQWELKVSILSFKIKLGFHTLYFVYGIVLEYLTRSICVALECV